MCAGRRLALACYHNPHAGHLEAAEEALQQAYRLDPHNAQVSAATSVVCLAQARAAAAGGSPTYYQSKVGEASTALKQVGSLPTRLQASLCFPVAVASEPLYLLSQALVDGASTHESFPGSAPLLEQAALLFHDLGTAAADGSSGECYRDAASALRRAVDSIDRDAPEALMRTLRLMAECAELLNDLQTLIDALERVAALICPPDVKLPALDMKEATKTELEQVYTRLIHVLQQAGQQERAAEVDQRLQDLHKRPKSPRRY